MKRGLLIVVGVVVVVAAVVAYLVININPLIKDSVETYGSEITKVAVTLDEADISPWSGTGKLAGLTVGNPEGYKTDSAFRLGVVSVDLDIDSVTTDTVIIREVLIAGPQVTYEIGPGGNNIDVIRKNVDDFVGGGAKPSGEAGSDDGPKIIIENLIIRDGQVAVSASMLQGQKLTAPLPAIHLKDIGKDEGGASPGAVAEQVMAAVTAGATKAVSSLDISGMVKDLGKNIPTEAIDKSVEGAGDAAKSVGESADKTLKKLFGK